jgi:hypothetical protein
MGGSLGVFQRRGAFSKNLIRSCAAGLSTKRSLSASPLELDTFDSITVKKYSNYVYNGNLNYLFHKKSPKLIFYNNMGKRLLCEIIYKTSNFVKLDLFYFDVLHKYNIDIFINSYGFYNKLNKYYNYELAFHSFDPDIIEIENIIEL